MPLTPAKIYRLSNATISHGLYNLYCRDRNGSKSFLFRWQPTGSSTKELSLGSVSAIELDEAIDAARMLYASLRRGEDPRAALEKHRRLSRERTFTFGECARKWLDKISPKLTLKSIETYESQFRTHVLPIIGSRYIAEIGRRDILDVLEPLQRTTLGDAIRGNIERVLDFATYHQHRPEELSNPAKKSTIRFAELAGKRTQKLPYLPIKLIPDLYSKLVAIQDNNRETGNRRGGSQCLRLIILTGCGPRPQNFYQAEWKEFDLEKRLWTVPGIRMKIANKKALAEASDLPDFRVPLTANILDLLEEIDCWGGTDRTGYLFPNRSRRRIKSCPHINENAIHSALVGTGYGEWARLSSGVIGFRYAPVDFSIHGFRTVFRTWAAGQRAFRHEVAEVAIAHVVGSRVSRTYNREEYLEERHELLEAWGRFVLGCDSEKVIAFPNRYMLGK